jgi:hypothetical protein
MSEALLGDPGIVAREAVPRAARSLLIEGPVERPRPSYRVSRISGLAAPPVESGQLWYVELSPSESSLSPLDRQVLETANVVIYDRSLAPTVAKFLPIGGYAEPAALDDGEFDPASERCLRFACEGWSVARLVDPDHGRVGVIRRLSERLLGVGAAALPVSIFSNVDGSYEKIEATLDRLVDVIDIGRSDRSAFLTIVFRAIDVEAPPRVAVASTNGLAG